ncbi:MAG TPA: hypothetical protein PKA06_01860, partial [Gemmatales bacterium]|nr:hypothetical protein [Gemmatales bacterium]
MPLSLLREKPNQPALHLLLEDSVGQPEENRLLHNEQVLVQACRAGDPMAMKDMVSRFQNDVYRV